MSEAAAPTEKVQLVIQKGEDAELRVGGLRFVACRREVDEIDGGITLYIWSANAGDDSPAAGEELLRFDFFRNRPHYHSPADNQAEIRIQLEDTLDARTWGINAITENAVGLVRHAGFDAIADALDVDALSKAGPRLEALFSDLAEPTETSYFEVDAKVLAALR